MNWTITTNNSIGHIISYPTFAPETKKETKWSERMNSFYKDIIDAAIKSSEENDCKCYIEITAEATDNGICVQFCYRARQRGRTLKSISNRALWKNGVIVNKVKCRNI